MKLHLMSSISIDRWLMKSKDYAQCYKLTVSKLVNNKYLLL